MASKIQFRRGLDIARADTVLDVGEPAWTIDTQQLYIGDGYTPGGVPLAPPQYNYNDYSGAIITGLIVAENIADLRNINVNGLPNKTLVYVKGYYIAGDRGGGFFYWDSSYAGPEDSGYWIKSNTTAGNGRWIRNLNGEVANIKMWGAKGDYTTDDTDAIQRALRAVSNNYTNQQPVELKIPKGVFLISGTLVCPPHIRLFGENKLYDSVIMQHFYADCDGIRSWYAHYWVTGGYPGNNIWDHNVVFENFHIYKDNRTVAPYFGSNSTRDIKNAGIFIYRPGEATRIEKVVSNQWGYGVKVRGIGAPGIKISELMTHWVGICAIKIEDSYEIGNNIFIDRLSCDFGSFHDHPGVSGRSGCAVWLDNSMAFVHLHSPKIETQFVDGIIKWDVPAVSHDQAFFGKLIITNGSIQCSRSSDDSSDYFTFADGKTEFFQTDSLVHYKPKGSMYLDVTNEKGQYVPATEINGTKVYNLKYLINDEISDYKFPMPGRGNQTVGRTPFIYEAIWANTGHSSPLVRPRIRHMETDTSFVRLQPDSGTGWYRIAQNTASERSICGDYTISRMKGGTLHFSVSVDNFSRPKVRINNYAASQASEILFPKIRVGKFNTSDVTGFFIDLFVKHVYGSQAGWPSDPTRSGIWIRHDCGIPGDQICYTSSLINPYFITKEINADYSADVNYYEEFEVSKNFQFYGPVVLSKTSIPYNSSSAGMSGQLAWDSNYLYICVSGTQDTGPYKWKRIALSNY